MHVGLSMRSAYPTGDVREGARWMIERARAARDAGLDGLFVGDHHAVPVPYYQNSAILGRLLAEWDAVGEPRAVGALYLLPLWHPVLLAEQVGTLASIARGPFVLQCAIGSGEAQFAPMGVRLADRPRLFEAALDAIRRLWEGEEVSIPEYGVRGARIAPLPPERVEVWIGASAPKAIDRAARLGDAWLADPSLTPSGAGEKLELYRERCEAHGAEPGRIAIRRDVHVGADDADARRVAGPILERGYRGFDPDAVIVGGPQTVAGRLRDLADAGYTDAVLRHLADDQSEVLASFERLAEVREAVRDA